MFAGTNKKFYLSLGGIVLFYLIFVVYSDITKVFKSLISMNLEFIPAILMFITFGILIKAIRQYCLLRFNEIKIPFKQNFIIFIAGLSLIFAPAGVGAMIKSKIFNDRYGIPIRSTVPIITLEIYHEFLGLVTLIAVSLIFYNTIEGRIAIILGLTISFVIYINLKYPKIVKIFKKLFTKLKLLDRLIGDGEEFQKSFSILTSKKQMFVGWSITVSSMLADLIATYLIFLSFNVNLFDFVKVSQMNISSLLLGQISFLPNGIGITDGSFIGILVANKLNLALATSIVLVVRFIGLWFKTSLGFIALKILEPTKR